MTAAAPVAGGETPVAESETPAAAAETLHYGIDRLVARGRRVFGWGWIADAERAIESLTLTLDGDGWQRRLPVNLGLTRADVEEAFPRLAGARGAGFVVTGYADATPIRAWKLEAGYADGERRVLDVTSVAHSGAGPERARRLRAVGYLARAVWKRILRGDLRGIVDRAGAQNYLAPSLDAAAPGQALVAAIGRGAGVALVFDHSMGGGANVYRRAVIDGYVAQGTEVLLCTCNLPTLDYRIEHFRPNTRGTGDSRVFRASSFLALEPIIDALAVDELFVNSPVSFDDPLPFAEWLAGLREARPSMRLTVAINDYFAVCPSFVLLNAEGRYCGIPALSECARCLSRHRASWMALSPPSEIGPWRAIWGRCLGVADEVRCFSGSSRELILRAHPQLDPARITVVPHRVDYLPQRLPAIDRAAPLTVGIIGQISIQKGALIVRDLVARADREALPLRVAVIGALDLRVNSPRLTVTGRYRREDLTDLIEAQGINLLLFPSICPETFSYVIEETMRLRMPIVAFDLGAPGERLRGYAKARLCSEVSADAALDALIAFHRELAEGWHP